MFRLWPALFLVGCDRLQRIADLADPVVAQGLFLGLEVPDGLPDLGDVEGFQYAAACTVFLGYFGDPSEITEAPVEGAELQLRSPANGRMVFRDEGEGKYMLDSSDGLVYSPGDALVISFEVDGVEARLDVVAPEPAELELPEVVEPETAVDVDLSDYDFEGALAASYDLGRGRLAWDNLPLSVEEVYDFTHAEGEIDAFELPPEALLRQGTYIVGVAGMQITDPQDFTGVNTSLSAFSAGQIVPRFVAVINADE